MSEANFSPTTCRSAIFPCNGASDVTGAGIATVLPGEEYPQKGHPTLYDFRWDRGRTLPEFAINFISEGGGEFESRETGEMPIGPGSLFLLAPGVWHRYRPHPQSGWTERWFNFSGEIAHCLICALGLHAACAVGSVHNPEKLADKFNVLLERIHCHTTQNSVMLSLYAMAFLIEAIEHSSIRVQAAIGPRSPAAANTTTN